MSMEDAGRPGGSIWDAIVEDLVRYDPEVLALVAGKLIQHAGVRRPLVRLFLGEMQPLTRKLFMGHACAIYSGVPE